MVCRYVSSASAVTHGHAYLYGIIPMYIQIDYDTSQLPVYRTLRHLQQCEKMVSDGSRGWTFTYVGSTFVYCLGNFNS